MAVTEASPVRAVLEGVPQVNFFCGGERCPEDVPFPSCLRATLEFLNDGVRCQEALLEGRRRRRQCCYGYIMGASGAAFRLLWSPQRWDGANTDLMTMCEDPLEPYRRAFFAVGYECEVVAKDPTETNESEFRACIKRSIGELQRPLLALGVVGPPECGIVTGYDNEGDVLIGWSFFQDSPEHTEGLEFEPSGYFRKQGWYADTEAVMALGTRHGRPEPERVLESTIQWVLSMANTPVVCGRFSGLTAYEAWADALGREEDFPAGDLDALRERHVAHNDAVGTVAEGRWYASRFCMDMAEKVPGATRKLLAAAGCYEAEHDLMRKLWALMDGNGMDDRNVLKLADPEVRAQSARIILQAREKEVRALEHLESVLEG
jgi:hypothetical protein